MLKHNPIQMYEHWVEIEAAKKKQVLAGFTDTGGDSCCCNEKRQKWNGYLISLNQVK